LAAIEGLEATYCDCQVEQSHQWAIEKPHGNDSSMAYWDDEYLKLINFNLHNSTYALTG
jgi:hypothetical protein